jgi:hypothetical protein
VTHDSVDVKFRLRMHAHLSFEFTSTLTVAGAHSFGDVILLDQVKPEFTLTSTAARHYKVCDFTQLVKKVRFDHNRKVGLCEPHFTTKAHMSLLLFTSHDSQPTIHISHLTSH